MRLKMLGIIEFYYMREGVIMDAQVDAYINNLDKWQDELGLLQSIALDCGLTEVYKWRAPCYTIEGKNVLILANLSDYCTLSFFKGALLTDPENILEKPGANTRSARIIKFTNTQQIHNLETTLKTYIQQAIENEKQGLTVDFSDRSDVSIPEEFQIILDANPTFQQAFDALTPGRQRAYNIYFAGAKQSKTRTARVEKYMQRILDGKGINDCVCGLTKRPPSCDGSHKFADKNE